MTLKWPLKYSALLFELITVLNNQDGDAIIHFPLKLITHTRIYLNSCGHLCKYHGLIEEYYLHFVLFNFLNVYKKNLQFERL